MIVTAATLFPVSSPAVEGGGLRIRRGVIEEVAPAEMLLQRYPGDRRYDFPDCVLLPGLVNAHTHLEYSAFASLAGKGDFVSWIRRLVRLADLRGRFWGRGYWERSALIGVRRSLAAGITCVGDVVTFGGGIEATVKGGLRSRSFLEAVAVGAEGWDGLQRRILSLLEGRAWSHGRTEPGIAPHSIYTLAPAVLQSLGGLSRRRRLPLSLHLAESPQESDLLAGRGPLEPQIARWGLPFGPHAETSYTSYLRGLGLLGRGHLLVHAVHLSGTDLRAAAEAGAVLVTCPRSNTSLGCGLPDYHLWRKWGATFVYGTDSLASAGVFDLFEEARTVRRALPEDAGTVLRRMTLGGAEALGFGHLTGSLERGKAADFILLRLRRAGEAREERIVAEGKAAAVAATVVGGRFLYRAGRTASTVAEKGLSLDTDELSTAVTR